MIVLIDYRSGPVSLYHGAVLVLALPCEGQILDVAAHLLEELPLPLSRLRFIGQFDAMDLQPQLRLRRAGGRRYRGRRSRLLHLRAPHLLIIPRVAYQWDVLGNY